MTVHDWQVCENRVYTFSGTPAVSLPDVRFMIHEHNKEPHDKE